ncbi:MAG: N-acyl homoserine lactonase family protein [Limnochordaceae bacterium]|nr:N-acyl homoserine lactonase family protein [Limnochordaceae bacterium]
MRMYLLYYGVTNVDKGLVLTDGRDVGKIIPTPIWGTLLETPEGWILVDTGMHPDHLTDPNATFRGTPLEGKIQPIMEPKDLASARVRSCGVEPEHIRYVINTHLHFDHCGGNRFFPQAEFIVQAEHFEWAMQSDQCHKRDFDLPGTRWRLVRGRTTVVPGVELIPTPGHVPGHQSVLVHLPQTGPVILTADAITLYETVRPDAPVTAWDPVMYKQSAEMLLRMQRELNAHLFVSHEQEVWDRWRHAPEFYC